MRNICERLNKFSKFAGSGVGCFPSFANFPGFGGWNVLPRPPWRRHCCLHISSAIINTGVTSYFYYLVGNLLYLFRLSDGYDGSVVAASAYDWTMGSASWGGGANRSLLQLRLADLVRLPPFSKVAWQRSNICCLGKGLSMKQE